MHDGSDLLGGVAGPQEVGWGTWNGSQQVLKMYLIDCGEFLKISEQIRWNQFTK